MIGGYGINRITGIFLKIGLVLLGTFGGMISGAMFVYFLSSVIYQMVYSGAPINPMQASEACARGMAVGYLSILVGTLLGTVLGCVGALNYIAMRRRLRPARRDRADRPIRGALSTERAVSSFS
jgi:hypothetical protein